MSMGICHQEVFSGFEVSATSIVNLFCFSISETDKTSLKSDVYPETLVC